jgi:hypothetical protein
MLAATGMRLCQPLQPPNPLFFLVLFLIYTSSISKPYFVKRKTGLHESQALLGHGKSKKLATSRQPYDDPLLKERTS